MAKAKKKAKRYTAAQKKEVLDFIKNEGRGGQTKAVTKFKVTAATIASWRRKEGGTTTGSKATGGSGSSKELRALEELASLLKEISATEDHLAKLKKNYKKIRAKL